MSSTDDWILRPALPIDGTAIAGVQQAARDAAPMPPAVHSAAEVEAFLTGRIGNDEVWLIENDDEVLGYARFTRTWLDDLYVLPAVQGHGVGSILLDLVKVRLPDGFGLWVFETNQPARNFYGRHGLIEREHTDGSDNEERAPDLRMEWLGSS